MGLYKYDSNGLKTVINSLKANVEDYESKISDLTTLVNSIDSSSSWKQEKVKPEFIKVCNEYIAIFSIIIIKLEAHIKYLEAKNNSMESFELAYTKRG